MPPKPGADPDHNLYLRGGVYWCRYMLNGTLIRVSLRTDDVKAARRERNRLLRAAADLREGRAPAPVRRWEEAVELYLELQGPLVRNGSLAATALARYETSLRQISPALEGTPLAEITNATVLDYVRARREEGCSASTLRNDLTAWSRVLAAAGAAGWIETNPARNFDRRTWIGRDDDTINPPTDAEVATLIADLAGWSQEMADLVRFLRETGARLGEVLLLERRDMHPDGVHATFRRGVKRNRHGAKIRTVNLGRAAAILPRLAAEGRLFAGLPTDSAAVSTRFGQWRRQRQGAENRLAEKEGRSPVQLDEFRLHDQRHAFAIASLIDDPTCLYPLMEHLGHASVKVTEGYLRFLRGEGAQRRYSRDPLLFGAFTPVALGRARSA